MALAAATLSSSTVLIATLRSLTKATKLLTNAELAESPPSNEHHRS